MNAIPHLAGRVFGTPLMVEPRYANVVAGVLLDKQTTGQAAAWAGPGGREKRPYEVVDGVAIVPILGGLVARSYGLDAMSGLTDYATIEGMLMEAATDPGVSGIMLDIDSPGGDASGPFELSAFIRNEVRGLKPVWAVAQYQACSAAYAIASAAERLYVAPSGDVGSIGVVMLHRDQSAAEQAAGLKYTYIFAGEGKTWGNPHEPLSAKAEAEFKGHVTEIYDQFVTLVTSNRRSLSADRIRENGARVFSAQNAVSMGYADKIGVMRDALTDFTASLAARRPGGSFMLEAGKPEASASTERHPAASLETDSKEPPMSEKDNPPAGIENAAKTIDASALEAMTKAAADAAAKAERDRVSGIVAACTAAGVPAMADSLITAGTSVEEAKAKIDAAGTIRDLCKKAGFEDSADGYIKAEVSVTDVRAKLLDAIIAQQSPEIANAIPAGGEAKAKGAAALDLSAAYAKFNNTLKG